MLRVSLAPVTILAAMMPNSASAKQLIYQCIGDGYFTEVKVVDGEWFERGRGEDWKGVGCKLAGGAGESGTTSASCRLSDDRISVSVPLVRMEAGSGIATPAIDKTLVYSSRTYSFSYRNLRGDPASIPCETYREGRAAPWKAWPLSRKLAAGLPFLLVLDRSALELKKGNWYHDAGRWAVIEGQFHPASGTWSSRGVGFNPVGNPLQSCPKGRQCGGVHERGKTLDRPYRPEKGEIIVFGQELAFDNAGAVLKAGRKVGTIVSPDY